MRLVCPNCAAQYEVDVNAIPEAGRDVQCANCGNTWFQERAPSELSAPDPSGVDATADDTQADFGSAQPTQDVDEYDDDDESHEAEAEPPIQRQQTPVDPSVLDILRSEAEREAAARDAEDTDDAPAPVQDDVAEYQDIEDEPQVVETPEAEAVPEVSEEIAPEPAEGNLAERARASRSRLRANSTGRGRDRRLNLSVAEGDTDQVEETPDDTPEEVAPAPKREGKRAKRKPDLPNVDELNSSLRSASDKNRARDEDDYSDIAPERNIKSRLGFYLAILIALALLATYALAPQIIATLPEAKPYIDGYVTAMDQIRHQLARGVEALIGAVQNLLARFL